MNTSPLRSASFLFAIVIWSVHGLNRVTPAQPPTSFDAVSRLLADSARQQATSFDAVSRLLADSARQQATSFDTVSRLLADSARQQADRGRLFEHEGKYFEALQVYLKAIAGLDRNFDPPSNHATGNSKAFLVRGGAYVDVARAWSLMRGNNQEKIIQASERAEFDFNAAIRNSKSDSAGRDMIQKAMLGRGYAWLLRGDLTRARKDFGDIKSPQTLGPLVNSNQVQGAIIRIDSSLAAQAKLPSPIPIEKLLNLGLEIAKVAFPKYQGIAVAISDLMKEFRK